MHGGEDHIRVAYSEECRPEINRRSNYSRFQAMIEEGRPLLNAFVADLRRVVKKQRGAHMIDAYLRV